MGLLFMASACNDGYEKEPVEHFTLDYVFSRVDSSESNQRTDETLTPGDEDQFNIGKGIPDLTYGITINLEYKGFDFSYLRFIFDFSPALNYKSMPSKIHQRNKDHHQEPEY